MYILVLSGCFPKNFMTYDLIPISVLGHYYLHFVDEEAEAPNGVVSHVTQLLTVTESGEVG